MSATKNLKCMNFCRSYKRVVGGTLLSRSFPFLERSNRMKKQKKELPRLSLTRETLQRLDEPILRALIGGDGPPSTQVCCPVPN